jgi:hypothetical protein
MKMLSIFFIITQIHKAELYFIKNKNTPKCANCKFFIPTNNECSHFGEADIITNEYMYEHALDVRKDDTKCGEDAIFFKQNYFKFITIPYYFLVENKDRNFSFSPIMLSFLFAYCILHAK